MVIIAEAKGKLNDLDQRCYDIMRKGHRPGTRKNKRSQATIYSKFCKEHGLNEYPADEWQFVRYACYTSDHVTSVDTVKNYVGGVRSLQQLEGYAAPSASSPNLKLAISGIRTELAHPVKQSLPLNREIIIDIAQKVVWTNSFHLCCYSAILTGFYLCVRPSNLVPLSVKNFNTHEQLTRGNVSIDDDLQLGMFNIEWSKTVQFCERDQWLAVRPASRQDICPLATLMKLFHMVPADDHEPCFCFKNPKKVRKALTYAQLSEQYKKCIRATGRDDERYTLHGMRRGSTTHAVDAGIDSMALKLLGNWSSDCYLRYIDTDIDKRVETAVRFSENM